MMTAGETKINRDKNQEEGEHLNLLWVSTAHENCGGGGRKKMYGDLDLCAEKSVFIKTGVKTVPPERPHWSPEHQILSTNIS